MGLHSLHKWLSRAEEGFFKIKIERCQVLNLMRGNSSNFIIYFHSFLMVSLQGLYHPGEVGLLLTFHSIYPTLCNRWPPLGLHGKASHARKLNKTKLILHATFLLTASGHMWKSAIVRPWHRRSQSKCSVQEYVICSSTSLNTVSCLILHLWGVKPWDGSKPLDFSSSRTGPARITHF